MAEMKEISFDEFKRIYKNYYKDIVQILMDNNVPFSCACGTMLGAVREADIIEWDYDIDNFFFIEDVDKLLSVKDKLPSNFYFETYLDGKLRYGLIRIICKNLYRHDRLSSRFPNVWIDFFAIRNVDIKETDRSRIYDNVLKEEKQIAFKNSVYKSKNFIRAILRKIYTLFLPSYNKSSKRIERKVRKMQDGKTCIMCRNCRLVSPTPINRDNVTLVEFGGFKIPCYSNYEEILTSLFGTDWQTPREYGDRVVPEFYIVQ